jgi:hypothetical protein
MGSEKYWPHNVSRKVEAVLLDLQCHIRCMGTGWIYISFICKRQRITSRFHLSHLVNLT